MNNKVFFDRNIAVLMHELIDAFSELRNSWKLGWAGLPTVTAGTLSWLLDEMRSSSRLEDMPLFTILMRTADVVEMKGAQMANNGVEPAYHNRLHIADSVVSMACLLRANRQLKGRESKPLSKDEALCILTMLVHDYGHEGHINLSPRMNETQSIFLYTPIMKCMGLSAQDLNRMNAMVWNTDPTSVSELHRKFKKYPASARPLGVHEMEILVTEADILASALPYPGIDLSRSLSAEWSKLYEEKSASLMTCEGRLGFLKSGAHFSSEAAKALGLPALVTSQLQQLKKQSAKSNQ
jgi:hypothetical protein